VLPLLLDVPELDPASDTKAELELELASEVLDPAPELELAAEPELEPEIPPLVSKRPQWTKAAMEAAAAPMGSTLRNFIVEPLELPTAGRSLGEGPAGSLSSAGSRRAVSTRPK
jgi:hypothetical protein